MADTMYIEALPVTLPTPEVERSQKVVVTHKNPDMDATMSSWMIKRFLPGWKDADITFVNVGARYGESGQSTTIDNPGDFDHAEETTFDGRTALHVDTGFSPFDHHQPEFTDRQVCATSLVTEHVQRTNVSLLPSERQALAKLSEYAVTEDHFRHIYLWDKATIDGHYFTLYSVLRSLKTSSPQDSDYTKRAGVVLDGMMAHLQGKESSSDVVEQTFQDWVNTTEVTEASLPALTRIWNYMQGEIAKSDPFSLRHILSGMAVTIEDQAVYRATAKRVLNDVLSQLTTDVLPAEKAVQEGEPFVTASGKRGIVLHTLSKTAEVLATIGDEKGKFQIVLQLGRSFRDSGGTHARIGLMNQNKDGTPIDPNFNLQRVKDEIFALEQIRTFQTSSRDDRTDIWFFPPHGALATNSDEHTDRIPTGVTQQEFVDIITRYL